MRVNFKELEARVSLECDPTFREFEVRHHEIVDLFVFPLSSLTFHFPFFYRMDIIFVALSAMETMTLPDA